MPVPSTVADLSSTASSNYPSGSESIGTSLDDYLRAHASIIKQVSDAKADASHTQAASTISDSTAAGRALLTAADAAAQRTALGLGTAATSASTAFAASGAITGSGLTQSTGTLIGRTTASTGAPEEITVGSGLSLSSGVLSSTASSGPTLGTAQSSTSGTSIDFTSIPAGTKRITVMLAGVSTNGSSQLLLQLGDSGGVENTGYTGTTGYNASYVNHSAGFNLDTASSPSAATVRTGAVVISLLDGNQWVAHGVLGLENTAGSFYVGGRKTLSATLDRIRITTVGGSDTFDAGSINIMYE